MRNQSGKPTNIHERRSALSGLIAFGCGLPYYVLAIIACWAISKRLTFELLAPLNWDSPIYWAVGRGLINGLLPYRDLIEAKPPGIFVVSALANLWSDASRAYGAFQCLILLLLFLTPGIVLLGLSQRALNYQLASAFAFPASALLTLFCAERAGNFQVESFGACFIAAYAAALCFPTTAGKTRLFLLATCLAAGIGFKEPFALIAVASAILICKDRRQFINDFVAPLSLALVIGALVLVALGILDDYLQNYVTDMFGSHLYRYNSSSLWERGLLFSPLKGDLAAFSSLLLPLLGLLAGASIVCGLAPTCQPTFQTGIPQPKLQLAMQLATKLVAQLTRLAFSSYLVALAVGAGGSYFGHHFAFATPFYFALLFTAMNEISRDHPYTFRSWRGNVSLVFGAAILVSSLSALHGLPAPDYAKQATDLKRWAIPARATANAIDSILDRCGIDRYQFIGHNGPQPYGYSKHSPLGPLFYFNKVWLDEHHQRFQRYLVKQLEEARLVVIDFNSAQLGEIQEEIASLLRTEFSTIPWECARGLEMVPEPYAILFREPVPKDGTPQLFRRDTLLP